MEPAAAVKTASEDAWQRAREGGRAVQRQLVNASGGVISAEGVTARLNRTGAQVEGLRQAGRLLGLPAVGGGFVYPVWQFRGHDILAGLPAVLAEFDIQDPWEQVAFFLSENIYLDDQTPLDELKRGRVDAVRRAARAYGEHGAP